MSLTQALLDNLSEGEDPYEFLSNYAWRMVAPPPARALTPQLYCLAGLLVVAALLIITSLFMRLATGTFWLYRYHNNPSPALRPHWQIAVACCVLVFCGLELGEIVTTLKYYQHVRWATLGVIDWRAFAMIPAFLAGFACAHSVAISSVIHLHTTGHITDAQFRFKVRHVTVAAVILPLACVVSILIVGIITSIRWKKALGTFMDLQDMWEAASMAWDGVSKGEVAPFTPILVKFAAELHTAQTGIRALFSIFAFWAVCLVLLVTTLCGLHMHHIRRVFSYMQTQDQLAATKSRDRDLERRFTNYALAAAGLGLTYVVVGGLSLFVALTIRDYTRKRVSFTKAFLIFRWTVVLISAGAATLSLLNDISRPRHALSWTQRWSDNAGSRREDRRHPLSASGHLDGADTSSCVAELRDFGTELDAADDEEDKKAEDHRGCVV